MIARVSSKAEKLQWHLEKLQKRRVHFSIAGPCQRDCLKRSHTLRSELSTVAPTEPSLRIRKVPPGLLPLGSAYTESPSAEQVFKALITFRGKEGKFNS